MRRRIRDGTRGLVQSYSLYILDLDGTLFRGEESIPHAVEVVSTLRRRGAAIRFLTNNSGQTREFYTKKLARLGFTPQPDEIYSSAIGAAAWLKQNNLRHVHCVGEPGLSRTLAEGGALIVNGTKSSADAVVVGICKTFTYEWLNEAMQQIRGGARFVATNTDSTYPVEGGKEIPGAGSIVAAIQTCGGQEPFVVGKPNPYLVELILKDAAIKPAEALVVGDRLETDILSGHSAGCPTHLVLTGVSKSAPPNQSYSDDLRGIL